MGERREGSGRVKGQGSRGQGGGTGGRRQIEALPLNNQRLIKLP